MGTGRAFVASALLVLAFGAPARTAEPEQTPVFVSGQGATDPATGKLAGADVATQTEQSLKNVRTILRAAGSDLQYALRCGVFLLDMKEFEEMNGVYSRLFGDHRPARTTIQAAALPGVGLRVEIDCIAYVP